MQLTDEEDQLYWAIEASAKVLYNNLKQLDIYTEPTSWEDLPFVRQRIYIACVEQLLLSDELVEAVQHHTDWKALLK
jgi:hypothetical protein